MRHNTLKLMACVCAVALGMTATTSANAQTANIPVTLTVTNAITVAYVADLDFGEWLMLDGTTDSTLVIDPFTDATVPTAGTAATIVNITPGASVGSVTVNTPAAASVDMYATITDFTSTALTLSTPTYSRNGTASATLSIASGTPTTIATTGGTDDTIDVGATLTISDTPLDGAHTANILMTFSY